MHKVKKQDDKDCLPVVCLSDSPPGDDDLLTATPQGGELPSPFGYGDLLTP